MGKATELADWLERNPLTPEELEEREGPRPRLRVTPDAIALALGPEAQVKDALDHIADKTSGEVTVLHDAESGNTAVALPAERYLELVTSYIRDRHLYEGKTNGQVAPSDATFLELGVAQVNPHDTWARVAGYNPGST